MKSGKSKNAKYGLEMFQRKDQERISIQRKIFSQLKKKECLRFMAKLIVYI
jgi:hypothetical protein